MNKKLSKEEQSLFEALHQERELDARTFNKPDYRGYWSSVVDKYKEKAHFVYELLQNADDANATEATFQLKSDCVIFRHNGSIHFTITSVNDVSKKGHINAITGIGNSTKNEKDGNTIGKFGVGFKAVFQYTTEPRIYDDKFWFKIENYIIPTALDSDYIDRKKGETVFEFPFVSPEASYKEILERLKTLDNPILFLRHLKKVFIEIQSESPIVYEKKVLEEYHYDNVTHELLSVLSNGRTDGIHMFTKEIFMTDENKKSIKQYISVGYFLDNNGELNDSISGKVFCFFPTAENFNLHCIVHAPFLLVDSRQQLKDDNHNIFLKKQLARLAADALLYLRDYGEGKGRILINENLFKFIPPKDNSPYYYRRDDTFRDTYIELIRDSKLLLGRGNKYISSEGAMICRPISMMNVITDVQLGELQRTDYDEDDFEYSYDWHFLREETQKVYGQDYVESILDELDIITFDGKDLASHITTDFMSKYGLKWAKRLYSHLRREQVNLWKRTSNSKKSILDTPFCLSPILLTNKGTWKAPYLNTGALNVYLPLANEVDEYNFVSDDYLKEDETRIFLDDLGLKEPDAWDYIRSVILKRHEEEKDFGIEQLNDDLAIVYDYITKITNLSVRKEKIGVLSKSFRLINQDKFANTAGNIYNYTEALQKYFRFQRREHVGVKFYKKFIDKYSEAEFINFLVELGVSSCPKLKFEKKYSFSHKQLLSLGVNKYTWCVYEDCYIDGFKDNVFRTIEESKVFWEWLSQEYDFESHKNTSCKYQYYSIYTGQVPTRFYDELINQAWIVLSDKTAHKPNEVGIEDLQEAEYKIDYKLIKFLGIERKTKSLKELGASVIQIQQNELGKLAVSLGFDTLEKLQMAREALEEKNRRESSIDKHPREESANPPTQGINSSYDSQRQTNLDEMSSSTEGRSKSTPIVEKSMDERVSEITQKLADEANRRIEIENKRAQIEDYEKYSKAWFSALLDLEYNTLSEPTGNKNGVKITFEKFRKESGSERIYQLGNPSRDIPIWLEDLGSFAVKFTFLNRDDVVFDFEVANVKDFTLRVKAKAGTVKQIDQIDWTRCAKAVIDVNSPVEIMHRLKTEFENLPYNYDYNFKNGLKNNISFVFGPPGTGKTTRLAHIIRQFMASNSCRILVLTPTNKACDVLTRKLIETTDDYSWLGRFVATGDEFIETHGALIDRSSSLYTRKKCCVVSTMVRLPYDGFTQTGSHSLLKDIEWDYIIIDEASMIPLVQIVYAIYRINAKVIIAGDPLQIAPIVREDAWAGENIYTMVELNNFENPVTKPIQFDVEKLDTQYRSLPSIGTLYSEYCYDGKLKHSRKESDGRKIITGNIKAKAVTFIPFRVEKFDSIYGAKKLQGSNVHIYSSIFAVEVCAYLAKCQQNESFRIGVICPYAPQAQLINKMIEQRTDIPANIEILVGTIHGFQGDQCDIIITVFNPPTGIKVAADKIMLNNRKIINVAISRACDYLFVLLPHPDSYGYENLTELNRLCGIANHKCSSVALFNADIIEKCIFGNKNYIESNTFVTTHQTANVYTRPSSLYEVRIDENAVDIQTSGNSYQTHKIKPKEVETVEAQQEIKKEATTTREPEKSSPSINNSPPSQLSNAQEDSPVPHNQYTTDQQYVDYFKKHKTCLDDALRLLISDCTVCSMFTFLKVIGSTSFANSCGWRSVQKEDIKSIWSVAQKKDLSYTIYLLAHIALQQHKVALDGISNILIKDLTQEKFYAALMKHIKKNSFTGKR